MKIGRILAQFNGAFSTTHLYTLLPQIVDKINRFFERLDRLAEEGIEFALDGYCTSLTFDVIGTYARIPSTSVLKFLITTLHFSDDLSPT